MTNLRDFSAHIIARPASIATAATACAHRCDFVCVCVCVEFVHATWHHLCLCTRTGGCGSASRRSGRDREREREREREKFIDNREREETDR